jgi:hypothetical protein
MQGKCVPMFVPKSVAAWTLTCKLPSTLPMISTAWLSAKWQSCVNEYVSFYFALVVPLLSIQYRICFPKTRLDLSLQITTRNERPPKDERRNVLSLTLFRITSMLPPASMTAVSPRSCTTLPSMRTSLCWKDCRFGARIRGVCGWSIV